MTDVRISRVDVDALSDVGASPTVRLSRLDADVLRDSTTPNFVLISRIDVDVLRAQDPISGAIVVLINGVDHSSDQRILLSSAVIVDELNERPNTLSLATRYTGTLTAMMPIVIALDADTTDQRIFAGTIVTVTDVPLIDEHNSQEYVRDVTAQDFSWLLDRQLVTAEYDEQSASTIVTSAMTSFSSGFTVLHVQPGLPSVEGGFQAINLRMSDFLTQVCRRIGANWYVDYGRDLHFYLTESANAPVSLTLGTRSQFWDVQVERDRSQTRTRVIVEGQGSTVTSDIPVGTTTIGVEDAAKFSVSGGTARLGTQVITYTGIASPTVPNDAVAVVNDPGVNNQSGVGGNLEGSWWWLVTAVDANGESPCSAHALTAGLFNLPVSSGIAGKVYWVDPSATAGRTYKIYRMNQPTANPFNRPRFPGDPNPTAGYNTASVFAYTTHSATPDVGLTTFFIYDLGDMVGWNALPSDYGVNGLTGVPPSGAGSVTVLQSAGTEVVVRVEVDDMGAQGTLATLEGGDGVHEAIVTDSSLDTAACLAKAQADLTDWSGEIVTVRYKTRDLQTRSGRTVHADLTAPAVSGDFLIQTVEIRDFDQTERPGGSTMAVYPVRYVTASPVKRTSLEDLLVATEHAA